MFSSCFCIFNEDSFGIFSPKGGLQDLLLGTGGQLVGSFLDSVLPRFLVVRALQFLLKKHICIAFKSPKYVK